MPRHLFKTLGARLTVWGASLTLAVCALWGLVLYAGLYLSLRGVIDTLLQGEVHEFLSMVQAHPNDYRALERAVRQGLGNRTRHDLAFRLFDAGGKLVVSSEPHDAIAARWTPPYGWERDRPHFHFDTIQLPHQKYPLRACSLRVPMPDGSSATAQASYVLDRMTLSLAFFRRMSVVALGIAAILAVVAGRLMAHRSLHPIQTLTDTAECIGVDHLDERILLTGTGDELDRLASTLNNMLDRIEHHVKRVQRFTADASHELRSPLAALRGSAEVALRKPRTADELRQVLEESIQHYDRLSHIAEDLLLLARADAGQEVAPRECVHLDDAVANVVALYAPLAQDRGIELVLEDHEPISLQGDGARLRQLVGNLIDNAIRFSRAGGRIGVSLTNGEGVANITVADTGQGIPADHLPHVFDRFYRADQARSAKHGGVGLGLPICRAIAEAHGGTITLSSTQGEGTTVTASIPVDVRTR